MDKDGRAALVVDPNSTASAGALLPWSIMPDWSPVPIRRRA
jgi:hypothetical protein